MIILRVKKILYYMNISDDDDKARKVYDVIYAEIAIDINADINMMIVMMMLMIKT